MAVQFEASGDKLTIIQRRRGLRIAMWLYLAFGILGAVLVNLPRSPHVTLGCSRAEGRCTVKHGSATKELALSSITGSRLSDAELLLERAGEPTYHLCAAPRSELAAAAEQITKFLSDPAAPTLTATCDSTIGSIPIAGRIAGIAGMLVVLIVLGLFLVETRVDIDRLAGTISMRGTKWPFRTWSVDRPLSEVAGVWVRRVYVGRGQRMPMIYVRFTDDANVLAFAPAAFRPSTVEERITALRRIVGRPAA